MKKVKVCSWSHDTDTVRTHTTDTVTCPREYTVLKSKLYHRISRSLVRFGSASIAFPFSSRPHEELSRRPKRSKSLPGRNKGEPLPTVSRNGRATGAPGLHDPCRICLPDEPGRVKSRRFP